MAEKLFQREVFQPFVFYADEPLPKYPVIHDPLELQGDWLAERVIHIRQ